MKNSTYYRLLVLVGIILWLAETAYFGWNDRPQSNAEKFLDTLSWIFIIWGMLGDISSNLTIKKDTNINAETVNVMREGIKSE